MTTPSTKSGPSWYNPKRAYGAVKSYFTSSKPTNDEPSSDPKVEDNDKVLENPPTATVEEPLPMNVVAEVSDIAEIAGKEDITANLVNPPRRHHRHRHGGSGKGPGVSPTAVPEQYNWAERRQQVNAVADAPVQEGGLSPFWTSVATGAALLSVYLVGREVHKWVTTRQQGKQKKEATRRQYNLEVQDEEGVEPHW